MIKYIAVILFLLPNVLSAEDIKIDLSPYEYDSATVTIFTPYSNVGVKHVTSPNVDHRFFKYGGPKNTIFFTENIDSLYVVMNWGNPLNHGIPIDTKNFIVHCELEDGGKVESVFLIHRKDSVFVEKE